MCVRVGYAYYTTYYNLQWHGIHASFISSYSTSIYLPEWMNEWMIYVRIRLILAAAGALLTALVHLVGVSRSIDRCWTNEECVIIHHNISYTDIRHTHHHIISYHIIIVYSHYFIINNYSSSLSYYTLSPLLLVLMYILHIIYCSTSVITNKKI